MIRRGVMLALALFLTLASAPWAISQPEGQAQPSGTNQGQDAQGVPAYHSAPPAKGEKLPPILGRDQLWGGNDQFPAQSHAYELAAKIQNVIYQQPCYCYCDRIGHKSLHSCFEGSHGAQCSTCMKELYYSYLMTKQHKTADEIRKGIIAGEWKQIDLEQAGNIN